MPRSVHDNDEGITAWDSWQDKADALIAEIRHRLLTTAELGSAISDLINDPESPFSAAAITLQASDPFADVSIGTGGEGDADSMTVALGDAGAFARISLWPSPATFSADRSRASAKVADLIRVFWRSDGRDRVGGILNSQRDDVQQALENTITEWTNSTPVALIFGDIDHFKLWNDQRHQAEGDRLIRKLAAALCRRAPDNSLVVRRGGDEFLIILPAPNPARVIAEAIRVRDGAENDLLEGEDPLEGETQIGLALGVAFITEPTAGYDEMELRADSALKPEGIKQRGCVSIDCPSPATRPELLSAELSIAASLSAVGFSAPFANVWLSYMSESIEYVTRITTEAAERPSVLYESVRSALASMRPKWDPSAREAAKYLGDHPLTGERSMSALDVAASVAHGLARSQVNPGEWELRWSSDGSAATVIHAPTQIVVFHEGEQDLTETAPVPALTVDADACDGRRAILVQIGPDRLAIPKEIFAETVYVDDRPTTGGGLPDLWEAALAQIVTSLARLPNVTAAIIAGDASSGAQTVGWLDRAGAWDEGELIDELADKLGKPTRLIRETSARLTDHVFLVTTPQEALAIILNELRTGATLEATRKELSPQNPPLRRSLNMHGVVLRREDGCRVATAYEAFPVALDIVRQNRQQPIYDQLHRQFTELIDFRIHLTNPTVATIPRYHLSTRTSFEEYFKREFCESTGKFRAALDANAQLDRVLEHVADAVTTTGYGTRRALLVVPHIPPDDRDIAPLGLVSIRIIPIALEGAMHLTFSYTWRTVEALVGLPYSLYGSIRFSEYLTEKVKEHIRKPAQHSIQFGELSYIAHSLHMYLDEYALNVARLIVNDATQ